MKISFFIITILISGLLSGQSVLSSGPWHKIAVTEAGVYTLDRDFFKREMDVDIASIDPRSVRIYGLGGGGMLPQANSIPRPSDPVELPIQAIGEQDGTFDDNDFFRFFSFGPHAFEIDGLDQPAYETNPYSDSVYYFITYGQSSGKRLDTAPADSKGTPKSTFTEYIIYENDRRNQLKSGRGWLGEEFRNSNRRENFRFDISKPTGPLTTHMFVAADTEEPCSYDILINDELAGNIPVSARPTGPNSTYDDKIKYGNDIFQSTINGNRVEVSLRYNPGAAGNTLGYLDYFILAYQREAIFESDEYGLIYENSLDQQAVQISAAEGALHVWKVTDPLNPKKIQITGSSQAVGGNGGQVFCVFGADYKQEPLYLGPVKNQNIKSLKGSDAIVISHPLFLSEAQRLANFHQTNDGLTVGVVTTNQVYNEFSSGAQDVTAIRDFLRYCYLEGGNLKYALLFGDASYDYKKRESIFSNYVPVYESRESAHPIFSHSSDDYFGFFEEHEGEWFEGVRAENSTQFIVSYEDHTLEIGVGRLPVKSVIEAQQVVDKIIRYKTASQTLGRWRNEMAYFSDDGDGNIHMRHAEDLFEIVDTSYAQYNAKKLYLDLFDQQSDAEISPAQEAMREAIKDGVFMMTYIGHGNERQLAKVEENVLTNATIRSMTNRHKLPLFVTATCEFGKYDDPILVSGAEQLLLNANGGAIALLTTTRPVYAHTNFPVNQALHESLFRKLDGGYPRLGDVIKATKNGSLRGPVNRNFALLGDPMLQLNYPEYDIVFNQFSSEADTLSALEVFTLSGTVQNDGTVMNDFNGTGVVTLWDIPQTKVTLGDENDPYVFEDQRNALFRGEVSVVNGAFEMQMIIPKNISYKYKQGKITMYAWNTAGFTDAASATRNFVLGGTAADNQPENDAPEVIMFMNDSSFSSGDVIGASSLLIAQISDESGINISDLGFNQNITLILNDREPIVLNEYYTAAKDTYQKGTLLYSIKDLEPGRYTATLKVSDIHNNSTSAQVEFYVSEDPLLHLYNTRVYPNPVIPGTPTTFQFEHDREGEKLEVAIDLYNMEGSLIHTDSYIIESSPRVIDDLRWDTQGKSLNGGIYLYRMRVTSKLDGASNVVTDRLIIIN